MKLEKKNSILTCLVMNERAKPRVNHAQNQAIILTYSCPFLTSRA